MRSSKDIRDRGERVFKSSEEFRKKIEEAGGAGADEATLMLGSLLCEVTMLHADLLGIFAEVVERMDAKERDASSVRTRVVVP
jgi:hypothetical protein